MNNQGIIHRARQIARDIELAFANSCLVIALSSERLIYNENHIFLRRYFLGRCADGSEVLFLTTNEDDEYPMTTRTVGDQYNVLEDFESLLDDLNTSNMVSYLRDGVQGPPKYVYYDIDFMDERFKVLFREHLENDVDGYSEDYLQQHFDEFDKERVGYWIAHVQNDFPNDNSTYRNRASQ